MQDAVFLFIYLGAFYFGAVTDGEQAGPFALARFFVVSGRRDVGYNCADVLFIQYTSHSTSKFEYNYTVDFQRANSSGLCIPQAKVHVHKPLHVRRGNSSHHPACSNAIYPLIHAFTNRPVYTP